MDIEILELCKENIQPLKKGRKVSQLGLALQAEVNTELQEKIAKERDEFEKAIITYDGPDPLQPRHDYVEWMEQTYIKHGRECNLTPLLEDTILLLKDNEKYRQDPRFIELIVKYVEAQDNAVELFQMIYSQGLGTMCSALYKAWADVLDQAQDFKRADQVYQLGIANHAEPLDVLKEAWGQFQLSVARKIMLSGKELKTVPSPEKAPRQVLGKLKKDIGSVRKAQGAAGVLTIKNKKSSTKQLSVFKDVENCYEHLISTAMAKNKLGSIATSEKNNEENTLKPGKWNKAYYRPEVSRMPPVPRTPSFSVHIDPKAEDEEPKLPPKTPSNILKTRKAELASSKAMEVFSSDHSAQKTLQSNLGLCTGGREFSFEELRDTYYHRKSVKNEIFQTPLRNTGQNVYDWQTPLSDFRPLNLETPETNATLKHSKTNDDETEKPIDCGSFVTPLKNVVFTPLTPLTSRFNFSEIEETTVCDSQLKKNPLSFNNNIYSEETPCTSESSYQSKTDLLPTIDENKEMAGDSTSVMKVPDFRPLKKQLFCETMHVGPSITQFSIFTDDD